MNFTPTEFIAVCNQSLEYAYANVTLEGEIASFKINQGKWVFFDLKDEESSISCFMTLYQMRFPLEDGMKVRLRGTPKLTKWGKFSFTVQQIVPVGEGNLKKSYEILKAKLQKEGLFAPEKKRPLPDKIKTIAVISSTGAAGYADFIKILNERWGGLKVQVAHTQVQGLQAPDQIIRALDYLNEQNTADIVAIIRGGGSADDLSAFNDEQLVRAIARSKIPVITGIGHEVDESLSDLAADIRASTPSNVAQLLTPDRHAQINLINGKMYSLGTLLCDKISATQTETRLSLDKASQTVKLKITSAISDIENKIRLLDRLNPDTILAQGYALVTGQLKQGTVVKITTKSQEATAEIKQVKERN
ncbi:exodeoxyribonuclease VII large subunit [Candidatus Saccharibacteria bacterium]|nr:exodeoxyribonuclease VII large subunit [Candidatus Saccharibacteria bacterium]MBR3323512.1 exodeoxyribonuclease VII large subunit [Candidatus Saccharibacteria bacterium]